MPSRLAPPERLGLDQGVTRFLSADEMQRLAKLMAVEASPLQRLAKPKGTRTPKGKPAPAKKKQPAGKPKGKPNATPKGKKAKR